MERHVRVHRERLTEVPRHVARERADGGLGELAVPLEVRPARDVDDDAGDGLVERYLPVRVARDTALVAERLRERLAEGDGHVLDGVVVVDLQVAVTAHREVEQPVFGERLEHVVEEADAGVDGGVALAVDAEGHLDLRLRRLPRDGGSSVAHTCSYGGSHKPVSGPCGSVAGTGRRRRETLVREATPSTGICHSLAYHPHGRPGTRGAAGTLRGTL